MSALYAISFIIAFILIGIYYIKSVIQDRRWIIVSLFVLSQLWAMASVFYVEINNSFSMELDREMSFNGSAIWYGIFIIVFMMFFKIGLMIYDKNRVNNHNILEENKVNLEIKLCIVGYVIFIVLTLISFVDIMALVVESGFGNRNHYNYVTAVKNYPLIKSSIITIQNYFVYPMLFITPFIMKKVDKKLKIVILVNSVLILIYFVLRGDKFGAYYNYLLWFGNGIILTLNYKNINIKKILTIVIPSFLVLGILLYGSVYINYSNKYNYNFKQTNNFILKRTLVLQGQVWWATYDLNEDEGFNIKNDRFKKDFLSLDSDATGLKSVMRSISPPEIIKRYEADGVRFSTGSPAIFVYYFGKILGMAMFAIASLILAIIVAILNEKLNKSMLATGTILSAYFINGIMAEFYIQGSFSGFYSKMGILMIVLFIILKIIINNYESLPKSIKKL